MKSKITKTILFLVLSICLISSNGNTVYASEQLAEYEREKGVEKLEYEKDLYLLSHLINAEAGSNWCSDDLMRYVGSVALNRVDHAAFPNTLEEVIYQPGQYACLWDGNFDKVPCERAVRIAKELLDNGSVLPANVVFQSEFPQGSGIYIQEQNTYLCIY